jgi:hypothetical protein
MATFAGRAVGGKKAPTPSGLALQEEAFLLNPPPGVRTEVIKAGLDARKACIEERSVVGNYVSTAEVRLTTQTGPSPPTTLVWVGSQRLDGRMPR